MTSRTWSALGALVLVLLLPVAAAAQAPTLRGYVTFGTTSLAASETFEAVADSSRALTFGGGVTATVWNGVFVDVAASRMKLDAERVFVNEGTVFPLGIPMEISIVPLDIAAGWRTGARAQTYVGAGLTRITYKETSDFSTEDEDVKESASGLLVLGGVDVALSNWLHAGGELRYRHVEGILGDGGVSQTFDEHEIGGLTFAVRISVGR